MEASGIVKKKSDKKTKLYDEFHCKQTVLKSTKIMIWLSKKENVQLICLCVTWSF